MGEAPAFIEDDLRNSKDATRTVIGNRAYLIGGADDESVRVQVLDRSRGRWVNPTVLGTKPKPCKGHSAVPLNEGRILVIQKGSSLDDGVWFLEVDTQYAREQRKILGTEVVAWSKGVKGNAEKPVVISGPSGVGKGTLISMLMKEFPSMFGFSVSHTTRAPRNMEKDSIHYHFTERSVMEKDIEDGKFLEFAYVHGNLYGTSVEAVEVVADAGKRCILDIDVQGARSVRASSLEAIFMFVSPPSMEELEKRLRARGTETEEQILNRLRNAQAEMEQGKSSGIFDHILYNDNLEECYENLKELLGLDGNVTATPKSSPYGVDLPLDLSILKIDQKIIIKRGSPDLPLDLSILKIDQKIIIKRGSPELKTATKNLIVLDLSPLKGGAPGRTRGLNVYAIDSLSDELNGFNQLS